MPEDTTQPGGQEAATQTPNDTSSQVDDEPFDKARAMATINKLREIEKEHAKLVKAEEARKREQMSETDRIKAEKSDLEKRLAEVQGKAKMTAAKSSVITAAAKAGFNDPDDAWNMLKESLTVSDDGEVDSLEKALSKLAESKPYLVKSAGGSTTQVQSQQRTQVSAGNPGAGTHLTLKALQEMSAQEIAAKWSDPNFQKDVEAAMKGG